MNIRQYENKLMGCWLGKNIGGTLGTPFESKRGVFDVDFYTHDLSEGMIPNDDLDLQPPNPPVEVDLLRPSGRLERLPDLRMSRPQPVADTLQVCAH